jgi:hypothetical protein
MVGFVRGENPPRVGAAAHVVAPAEVDELLRAAEGETESVVEVFDPEADVQEVRVESGELDAEVVEGPDPEHWLLRVRPTQTQRSQMFPMQLVAVDVRGVPTGVPVVVDVPAAEGVEVEEFEVRWEEPPAGSDPFDAPEEVAVYEVDRPSAPSTGAAGGLLGWAVYASTEPGFEPTDENLVALAPATARSARVVLALPLGKRDHQAWIVKVTARRGLGEGRASREAATDVPRVPDGTAFNGKKLVVPAFGSNLLPGAAVEVREAIDGAGERFALTPSRNGMKWVVKGRTLSEPGGKRLSEVMRGKSGVFLILINPNGRTSAPYLLTP